MKEKKKKILNKSVGQKKYRNRLMGEKTAEKEEKEMIKLK